LKGMLCKSVTERPWSCAAPVVDTSGMMYSSDRGVQAIDLYGQRSGWHNWLSNETMWGSAALSAAGQVFVAVDGTVTALRMTTGDVLRTVQMLQDPSEFFSGSLKIGSSSGWAYGATSKYIFALYADDGSVAMQYSTLMAPIQSSQRTHHPATRVLCATTQMALCYGNR
jgi:outer membrane protein assembly factor BamB